MSTRKTPSNRSRAKSLHRFDDGFVPTANHAYDSITVTHNSPVVSVVQRERPGKYWIHEHECQDRLRLPSTAQLVRLLAAPQSAAAVAGMLLQPKKLQTMWASPGKCSWRMGFAAIQKWLNGLETVQ